MTELIVLQRSDLALTDFDNDHSNGAGGVTVKVSKISGNLLQKRVDGLYYGINPPPNLTFLYVDAVNGVDLTPTSENQAGSRSKPFKTVAFATSCMQEGTNRFLYLMENQEHALEATAMASITAGTVVINTYGPTNDRYMATGVNTTELPRLGMQAKLVFRGFRSNQNNFRPTATSVGFGCLHVQTGAKVNFYNVEFILDNEVSVQPAVPGATNFERNLNFGRIVLSGQINFDYVKFRSRGVTALTGFTNLTAINVDEAGIHKAHTLNFIPLVATRDLSDTHSISFLGVRGWEMENLLIDSAGYGFNGFVGLSQCGMDPTKITAAVATKTTMQLPKSGDRVLVQPRTDINHSQWIQP